MKASESVKNYPSERRMYANYVARNIKKICKEIGPRLAGSESELKAQEFMAEDLKTSCDEVNIESFKLSTWAFMGWVQVCVFCAVFSAITFFAGHFLPDYSVYFDIASAVVGIFGVVTILTEFLFYKEMLDPFFKKSTSHNVVAVRKAAGETKRRIIFSGHADSAPEWRFTYWGGRKMVVPSIVISISGFLLVLVFSIVFLVLTLTGKNPVESEAMWICQIISVCFIPVFLYMLLFYNKKRIVEGANDNLTGSLISMAIPRYLQDHDIRFENTEVMVVITGSEESGLRGGKAFCKAHADEILAQKDVETVFYGIDTVRDFDYLAIYNKDMTGTVRNDQQVSELIREGAKIAGYDVPFATVSLGATDCAAISQAGLKGSSFAAMDPAPARYYHTRLDTHENLDLKTIEAGLDIALETAFLFDEKGLNK